MKVLKFFFFAVIIIVTMLACSREDAPVEIPEVEISGYIVTSLIQEGNQPFYFLKTDTVANVGDPVEFPEPPLKIVSSVYTGTIIKISK